MRLLSIVQFHHYAYMIISIALLGFGASGSILFIFRNFLLKYFETVMFFLCFLFGLLISYSTNLISELSFDPFLVIWNFDEAIKIILFYFVIFLPFLTGALILGLTFTKYPDKVNKLYFFNLIGSAIGGIGVIGFMYIIEPLQLNHFIAFLPLICLLLSFYLMKPKILAATVSLLFFILLFLNFSNCNLRLKISEYKSLIKVLKLPDAKVTYESFNPMGWVTIVSTEALRYAPGLGLSFTYQIPSQLGIFNDAEIVGTIFRDTNQNIEYLKHSTLTLPYKLKNSSEVLIIGSGPGTEIIRALENSAQKVVGVEINPAIQSIAVNYLNSFFHQEKREKFLIINSDGRGFLNQLKEQYDIIYFPLMNGFSASAAGYYAAFENYLLTKEAFLKVFENLKSNGILCLNSWTNYPPRHAIKLFSLLTQTLEEMNVKNPENYIVAVRSWSTVTIIAKKSPFEKAEIECVKNFCEENNFDLIYYPGIKPEEVNIYNLLSEELYYNSIQNILFGDQRKFQKHYIFNISAPTDEKPYFSNFLKLKNLLYLYREYGKENIPLYEWGYLLVWITFIQIFILSIVLIMIPVFIVKKSKSKIRTKLNVFLYFSGIGIGFMMIEIYLIQKFILFLSHPIYSVSIVISSILFFAGIGSLLSAKFSSYKLFSIRLVVLMLLIMLGIYYVAIPVIYEFFIHLPLAIKYIISFLIIAPLAFCMGMFFPLGIEALSKNNENLIPWAWGINGCLSVLSAVLAPIISIELGLKYLLLFSSIAYCNLLITGNKFDKVN